MTPWSSILSKAFLLYRAIFCDAMFVCFLFDQFAPEAMVKAERNVRQTAFDSAVVTPLRKAASYEPHRHIAILGIRGDTWLTRGKYGIYVAVRGCYGPLLGPRDAFWNVERNFKIFKILPRKISPIYCRVSYVTVWRIPSLVLRNTRHYVNWKYYIILSCLLRGGMEDTLVSAA